MSRLVVCVALCAAMLFLIFSCRTAQEPLQPATPHLAGPSFAGNPLQDQLFDIEIPLAQGTGIVAAGVGLFDSQPGNIDINVPGDVKQVLLYWSGFNEDATPGDNSINIGGNAVIGTQIGGPRYFFSLAYANTFRADITGLGIISPGANLVSVDGLSYTHPGGGSNGAALVVVYDDGSGIRDLGLKDGQDLAFWNFPPPKDTTVPQTFTFASADVPRLGNLINIAASADVERPTITLVSIDGGAPTEYPDLFQDTDGPQWDTVTLPVLIPAGATSLTVQVLSAADPATTLTGSPASIVWMVSALSTTPPEEEPPGGCRMTGGGVDEFGNFDEQNWVEGESGHGQSAIRYQCGGQAGASTALPPQPSGEWTHHQTSGPGGHFTFHAGTASAPEATEIEWIQCMDEGWCVQARQAPDKQIDFGGIGTFKNIEDPDGLHPGIIPKVSLHRFEVNVDDLGEPGKSGKQSPPGGQCPEDGFGRNGSVELADCGCPDFYRIRIYADTTDNEIIYEVYGYIRGGNFQIHPLTGNDTNN